MIQVMQQNNNQDLFQTQTNNQFNLFGSDNTIANTINSNNTNNNNTNEIQQQQQNQEQNNEESKEIYQAMQLKRDNYRIKIRKQNTLKALQSKRQQVMSKIDNQSNENQQQQQQQQSQQQTICYKSIKKHLPDWLRDQKKLIKYMSEICAYIKSCIQQINLNKNNNNNANYQLQQQQKQQQQNNNNKKEESSISSISSNESNWSECFANGVQEKKQEKQLQYKSDEEIYQEILSNLKILNKIISCVENEPTEYLILKENIQDILYFLVYIENQKEIQKQVSMILGNIVGKDLNVWKPMVEQDGQLCTIFVAIFKNKEYYMNAITGLGNICIDYPQIIQEIIKQDLVQTIQEYLNDIFQKKQDNNDKQIMKFNQNNRHTKLQIPKSCKTELYYLMWLVEIILMNQNNNIQIVDNFLPLINHILKETHLTQQNEHYLISCIQLVSLLTLSQNIIVLNSLTQLSNFSNLFAIFKNQSDVKSMTEVSNQIIDIMANLSQCDDSYIIQMNKFGYLDFLTTILKSSKYEEKQKAEASFAIRNLFACANQEVQKNIVNHDDLLNEISKQLIGGSLKVKKQLYHALYNFTVSAKTEYFIEFLDQNNFIEDLMGIFDYQDSDILILGLNIVDKMIEQGDRFIGLDQNPIKNELEIYNISSILFALQQHQNYIVYERVQEVIDAHFEYSVDENYQQQQQFSDDV